MKVKNSNSVAITRLIRLTYYNDVLLESGVISSREHQRVNSAILNEYQKYSLSKSEYCNTKKF